jgi:hypothetical protein
VTPGNAITLGAIALVLLTGCGVELPEPESPGAQLYRRRCDGCHRLYHPGALTAEMWRVQTERMQREFQRRGMPVLTPAETELLLTYLGQHSGGRSP